MQRGVRPMTLEYKGAHVTFDMPGWYCDSSEESIHTGEDMKASDRALNRLKAEVDGLPLPEEIKRIRTKLGLTQEQAGELIGGEGLAPPGQARIVRTGKGGVPAVTDGPFPESKEFLAGFWIVEVDRPERAYEIAAKASSAPGPGGKPLIIPIEVREVMSAPPSS